MKPLDVLTTAFMNLWRRKLRAFLTVLGMVIGTSSIVVMISLGLGIQEATLEAFAGTGSLTTITVNSWNYVENENGRGGTSTEKLLNKKTVEAFKKIKGVTGVMPVQSLYGIVKSGKYITDVSILAVDTESAKLFGIDLSDGRYPEAKGKKIEMVFSAYMFDNFYNPQNYKQAYDRDGNPLITADDKFQLTFDYSNIYGDGGMINEDGTAAAKGKFYDVEPVGTMSEGSNEFSWYCLMEASSVQKLAKENSNFVSMDTKKYDRIMVKCDSIEDVKSVKDYITGLGYGTYSLQDAVEMAEKQTEQIRYLLGAIGGVSLLVAAIGIMNTMMMSIYERTKEIGIIKVLGCKMSNIATLFLTEAAYIGLFGGALGLAISYGLSILLNNFLVDSGMRSVIPAYLSIGALVFSVFVALISGLYPAIRAMRLSPLSAIRNE